MVTDEIHGEVLGERYRVLDRLGAGGFGVVYTAEHVFTARRFAIKVLRPELGQDPRIAERFLREATTTAALDHENIVGVVDVGRTSEGALWFSMELLRGVTLEARLAQVSRLRWAEAREILLQLAEGLRVAHANGIVHRDLKPANIFLVPRARATELVKILDFGIAKLLRPEVSGHGLTDHRELLGTPLYMAPEQIAGDSIDARADIHAVGVILFEMLTGQRPFAGRTQTELMMRILRNERPRLSDSMPEIFFPEALEELVARAIALDPADRFPDAEALIAAADAVPSVNAETNVPPTRVDVPGVEPLAKTALAMLPAPSRPAEPDQVAATARMKPRRRGLWYFAGTSIVIACLGIYGLLHRAVEPAAIVYHACQIKITGDTPGLEGQRITDAWIRLVSGETTTVKVVGGRELKFRCLDQATRGALVVRFEDRIDHAWPDVLLYAEQDIVLPIETSRVVLPGNAIHAPVASTVLPQGLQPCTEQAPANVCRAQCEVANDATSCFLLANRHQAAAAINPTELTLANSFYSAACSLQHARACNILGASLDKGLEKRGRFAADALKLFDIACHLGESWGCFNAAMTRLIEGPGTLHAGAWVMLIRACDMGNARACNAIGVANRRGELGQQRDADAALRWFTRSCNLDDSLGAFKGCGNAAEQLAAEDRDLADVRALAERACQAVSPRECDDSLFGYAYTARCGQVASQACLLLSHHLQEGLGGPADKRRARKMTASSMPYTGEAAY